MTDISIEHLLKPRYRVIGRWPDMDLLGYYCDQIISLDNKEKDQWYLVGKRGKYYDAWFDGYPHLFRKLEWFEEREIEEMPQYVKVNTTNTALFLGDVLKVRQWKINAAGHFYCWLEKDKAKSFPEMFKYEPDSFLPATEQQYLDYINKKP